ncbi:MAG: MoxR family ATPase [Acidocella sp.]|nr:MoxR family ATPase [Acidocella sp.]
MNSETLEPRMMAMAQRLATVRAVVADVIIGQSAVIDMALVAILSGGHALLTGVPGLGKTRLVETLGIVLGLNMRRVQFTPDLMPSDILGSEVLDETPQGRKFRFIPGPIFTELLMADEINRASPRTQSALLQAMAEGAVAVAGESRPVPLPFHVLATQNPIEQEGTYPLPEAQLDRFLLDIRIDYPAAADERAMLLATTGVKQARPRVVLSAEDVIAAQALVRVMPVGTKVVDGIMALVRGARPQTPAWPQLRGQLAWGPGPRAAQALMLGVRARALLDGRLAPSLDDVAALAGPALRHRMALNFAAQSEGITLEAIIGRLTAAF